MTTTQTKKKTTKKTTKSKPEKPQQGGDEVVARLEEENKQLRDRVAQIEQDKREKAEATTAESDPFAESLGNAIDEIEEMGLEACAMVLPLADSPSNESQSRRVDLTLSHLEKKVFMRLRSGLRQTGAPLTDDAEPKRVHSNADVVRWLVRQIGQVEQS